MSTASSTTARRILVIDDSSTIRKAIRQILEQLAFVVDEAHDGAHALSCVLDGVAYTAVMCDIDMPIMDGLTFVEALRKLPGITQPPVIMCTTHNAFAQIERALTLGANEYIMKPFDAEIVAAKLAACGVE